MFESLTEQMADVVSALVCLHTEPYKERHAQRARDEIKTLHELLEHAERLYKL